ncbi:hypothetical protein TcWFU_009735 [Taenia crassiceps]|uniref:Uncharacterized protein n=1 Tax=Taenia crassiceps TaxID=6207 RepID=A0ABR4QC44_9CEST
MTSTLTIAFRHGLCKSLQLYGPEVTCEAKTHAHSTPQMCTSTVTFQGTTLTNRHQFRRSSLTKQRNAMRKIDVTDVSCHHVNFELRGKHLTLTGLHLSSPRNASFCWAIGATTSPPTSTSTLIRSSQSQQGDFNANSSPSPLTPTHHSAPLITQHLPFASPIRPSPPTPHSPLLLRSLLPYSAVDGTEPAHNDSAHQQTSFLPLISLFHLLHTNLYVTKVPVFSNWRQATSDLRLAITAKPILLLASLKCPSLLLLLSRDSCLLGKKIAASSSRHVVIVIVVVVVVVVVVVDAKAEA